MSKVSRKRKLLKKEFKKNLEELRLSLRVLNEEEDIRDEKENDETNDS